MGTIFGVFARPQTYINMFYLVLALPLGIGYFVFLVTGISLGFSLLVLALVGIPILLFVLAGSWTAAAFERELAIRLLNEEIPPMAAEDLSKMKLWARLKAHLRNPVTWTGIVYLFAKFPIGVVTFSVTVALVYMSVVFITAPITYRYVEIVFGTWEVDSLGASFVLLAAGLAVGLVTPHVSNLLARASGRFARHMLGAKEREPLPAI